MLLAVVPASLPLSLQQTPASTTPEHSNVMRAANFPFQLKPKFLGCLACDHEAVTCTKVFVKTEGLR